ncbi:IQ domain-containing protein C isoform X2 [Eublepharis macularius]|uniref:IQ domain-containing protein C isoform X2 n=1 Tax=Eublepharis macularius TaxID=481883 RepID=A0AA97KGL5_EUBMA|nr:IQ domain-containing protein C isoform X2 [Eublepharis macularius]
MATEEEERLLRRVMALQACVRGHLIRKRFQSLKGEYESIVKQIEGNLDQLQWSQHSIPKPVFLSKSVQKPSQRKELSRPEAGLDKQGSAHTEEEEKLSCHKLLQTENERDCDMQHPSQLLNETAAEAGEMRPHPEHPLAEPLGNASILPGENAEGKDCSNVSSEWGSLILEIESPRQSQELRFQGLPVMPQALPDLQHYRKHLTMELLWLQQAISSRKNYLILKQRLWNQE